MAAAGLLHFGPSARAFALIAWHLPGTFEARVTFLERRARACGAVLRLFNPPDGMIVSRRDIALTLESFAVATGLPVSP
ncbi:hypothetical protein, partial [Pseudomonas viridiflava]|uniref:hypothetical protein n=1 Tax=Pseudomonas viridiflava TaxID=33069 RepID=UPI0019802839